MFQGPKNINEKVLGTDDDHVQLTKPEISNG